MSSSSEDGDVGSSVGLLDRSSSDTSALIVVPVDQDPLTSGAAASSSASSSNGKGESGPSLSASSSRLPTPLVQLVEPSSLTSGSSSSNDVAPNSKHQPSTTSIERGDQQQLQKQVSTSKIQDQVADNKKKHTGKEERDIRRSFQPQPQQHRKKDKRGKRTRALVTGGKRRENKERRARKPSTKQRSESSSSSDSSDDERHRQDRRRTSPDTSHHHTNSSDDGSSDSHSSSSSDSDDGRNSPSKRQIQWQKNSGAHPHASRSKSGRPRRLSALASSVGRRDHKDASKGGGRHSLRRHKNDKMRSTSLIKNSLSRTSVPLWGDRGHSSSSSSSSSSDTDSSSDDEHSSFGRGRGGGGVTTPSASSSSSDEKGVEEGDEDEAVTALDDYSFSVISRKEGGLSASTSGLTTLIQQQQQEIATTLPHNRRTSNAPSYQYAHRRHHHHHQQQQPSYHQNQKILDSSFAGPEHPPSPWTRLSSSTPNLQTPQQKQEDTQPAGKANNNGNKTKGKEKETTDAEEQQGTTTTEGKQQETDSGRKKGGAARHHRRTLNQQLIEENERKMMEIQTTRTKLRTATTGTSTSSNPIPTPSFASVGPTTPQKPTPSSESSGSYLAANADGQVPSNAQQVSGGPLPSLPDEQQDQQKTYQCLVARTALILSFGWDDPKTAPSYWEKQLLARTIVDKDTGDLIPLWEKNDQLPPQAEELSFPFRQLIGFKERKKTKRGQMEVWRCRRLKLTKGALQILFPSPKIWALQERDPSDDDPGSMFSQPSASSAGSSSSSDSSDPQLSSIPPSPYYTTIPPSAASVPSSSAHKAFEYIDFPLQVLSVEAVLYPLGMGLLLFQLDWLPKKDPSAPSPRSSQTLSESDGVFNSSRKRSSSATTDEPTMTLDELRTCLFLAKFKHKLHHVFEGWTLGTGASYPSATSHSDASFLSLRVKQQEHTFSGTAADMDDDETSIMTDASYVNYSDDDTSLDEENGLTKQERQKIHKEHIQCLGKLAPSIYPHLGSIASQKKNASTQQDGQGDTEPPSEYNKYRPRNSVSLAAIGNWLLHLNEENPLAPPSRLLHGLRAHHHSTVVIDQTPTEADVQEYLFHLRRAFGQRNRPPPPNIHKKDRSSHKLDAVLVHRLNRYIGISREGTVSLSWPTTKSNLAFELDAWPDMFQGIYLILAQHAHGERAVLGELSNLSALQAEKLKLDSELNQFSELGLGEIIAYRSDFRDVATLMVRYTLSMSSDDCGGLSEYAHFFSTMREVFGIPAVKDEIREEIDDVLAIVESGYLEETRRMKQRDKRNELRQLIEKKVGERAKEAKRKRFELIVSLSGAVTLPLLIASGLWGMNNTDLPDSQWLVVVGVALAISMLLVLLLLVAYFCMQAESSSIKKYYPSNPFPRISMSRDRAMPNRKERKKRKKRKGGKSKLSHLFNRRRRRDLSLQFQPDYEPQAGMEIIDLGVMDEREKYDSSSSSD